jgi:hypothetical protein
MIETVLWGISIIIFVSLGAISIVIGIYYLITKNKRGENSRKQSYTLDKQKEV